MTPLLALTLTIAEPSVFDRDNLVAWCVVPFDARKRSPEERAAMLAGLGFKRFAYDWRAEHLPTFGREIEALRKHRIELTAVWFPATLNADARALLDVLRREKIRTQLWATLSGGPVPCDAAEQARRVRATADALRPIADAAAELGCTLGLYNHGDWFGEPDNQLAVCAAIDRPNVGLVYNQHHGHAHTARFAEILRRMRPHLLTLNLNGMTKDGDRLGKKILPLGTGDLDHDLLRVIAESGWRGPVGIIGHTQDDAEATLRANLAGLDRVKP